MMKIALSASVAALALGAAAHAQTVQPYVGAGGLYLDGDGADYTAALGRAGLDLGDYLGVEAEGAIGVEGDEIAGFDTDLEHILAGYGRLRAPLGESFEAFGRAGYYTAKVETDLPGGGSVSASDDDFAAGAGLEWSFAGRNSIRAEYTNYGLDEDGHSGALSYNYRF